MRYTHPLLKAYFKLGINVFSLVLELGISIFPWIMSIFRSCPRVSCYLQILGSFPEPCDLINSSSFDGYRSVDFRFYIDLSIFIWDRLSSSLPILMSVLPWLVCIRADLGSPLGSLGLEWSGLPFYFTDSTLDHLNAHICLYSKTLSYLIFFLIISLPMAIYNISTSGIIKFSKPTFRVMESLKRIHLQKISERWDWYYFKRHFNHCRRILIGMIVEKGLIYLVVIKMQT